jgi:gliding motility-associated-like protein
MKHHLFFFITLIFSVSTAAQTCIPVFKKTYGGSGDDEGHTIIYTTDKGSLVAGRTNSGTTGDFDALLLKLTESGTIIWSKRIGGNADDIFKRVKSTSDGGYIALGNTKSFGNTAGELLIVKTDAAGTITWSRHIGNAAAPLNAKDIIQLNSGGYIIAANENDSTINSNAVIFRLDGSGNVTWTKTFDHGNDDGVNSLLESGSVLYVAGYVNADRRDAILTKLDISTGAFITAKKFIRTVDWDDELINVERTNDGVAFVATSYKDLGGSSSFNMIITLFKMKTDGTMTFERRAAPSTNGYRNEYITARNTIDSGFVFALNDTTPNGFPLVMERGPTGMAEWGSLLNNFEYSRVRGIDLAGSDGYLYSGFLRSWQTGNKNKLIVYKAGITGKIGTCTQFVNGNVDNSSNYSITDNFNWNSISSINPAITGNINVVTNDLSFTTSVSCEEQRCYGAPPIVDTCNTSFFTRYEGREYNRPWDITRTSDGGSLMVGMYGSGTRNEPLITKLKSNGDVAWSKTVNQFGHIGFLKKLVPTTDGNFLILGMSNYTINNGSSDSSILMKVNSTTGNILWSRHCDGDIYDITPSGDGGFVFCLNRNYGFPPIYTYLVRINAAGSILWQKELRHWGGGNPVYRGVIAEGPFIYLGGDYYNHPTTNSILLEKFNLADGSRIWEQRFVISGETPQWDAFSKTGDTLFVGIRLPDVNNPFSTYNFGLLKIGTNGNSLGAFKIISPISVLAFNMYAQWNEHNPVHFVKTSDNNFLFAELSNMPGGAAINLTKFTSAGQLVWGRKYKNLGNEYVTNIRDFSGSLYILGRKNLGTDVITVGTNGFLLKTDSSGIVMPNGTGDCETEPSTAVFNPLVVTNGFVTNETPLTTNDIFFHDYPTYNRTVDMWAKLSCSIPASCSSIRLTGQNLICNPADTILYVARKNLECTAPVMWDYDQSVIRLISSTDSSIKVQFTNTGSTKITAKINNGCRDISDSILVSIARNAGSLNLGPDTTICSGNSIRLIAGTGFNTYFWQDGSTLDSFIVTAPGLYFVEVKDSCGRIARDSVNVSSFFPPPFSIGPDRIKCNSDTIRLDANPGLSNYSWLPNYNINSVSSPSVVVNPLVDTSYTVSAEVSPGCMVYDTIFLRVNHSLPINLGKDTSFCSGGILNLDAGNSFSSYSWNTGESTQMINVQAPGIYSVKATTTQGCNSMDTIRVVNVFALPSKFLTKDSSICNDETIQLKPAGNFLSYLWSNNSTGSSINIAGEGIYWLEVKDANNCKGRDSIFISVRQCIEGIFFPNAFTPNNDGKNDSFKPIVRTQLSSYMFRIYNRWGQVVFSSTEINKGWNGKINGLMQDGNVYIWTCTYQEPGKEMVSKKGSFVLIR